MQIGKFVRKEVPLPDVLNQSLAQLWVILVLGIETGTSTPQPWESGPLPLCCRHGLSHYSYSCSCAPYLTLLLPLFYLQVIYCFQQNKANRTLAPSKGDKSRLPVPSVLKVLSTGKQFRGPGPAVRGLTDHTFLLSISPTTNLVSSPFTWGQLSEARISSWGFCGSIFSPVSYSSCEFRGVNVTALLWYSGVLARYCLKLSLAPSFSLASHVEGSPYP